MISKTTRFNENMLNIVFKGVVEATEEAILNAMLSSDGMMSYQGIYIKSLREYLALFSDLLINEKN